MFEQMSQGWGLNVNGWSGLAAASTGPQGTGATQAAPATAAAGATPQGETSMGTTCGICKQPAARQGLFFVGVVLLALAWHFHLHSMLE